MGSRRATSFDIAELAGVSQSTVSRALSGSVFVREATRLKVTRAAERLRYKVDINARNLRTQTTRTLALLICDDPGAGTSHINPFFGPMLGAITREAAARGYDLLVSFQQFSDDWNADYTHRKRADGIIFLGYGDYPAYCERIARLDEAGAAFVTWGPVLPAQPGHFLGCDNFSGGRLAADHLLARGRRRIAFLGDTSERSPEFAARYAGYAAALTRAGHRADPALCEPADSAESSGRTAMVRLLDRGARPDAVFAATDLIAMGAIAELAARDIAAGRDVAVVGFDDIDRAVLCGLTTVRQDTGAAAQMLVAGVLAVMRGEPIAATLVRPELVVRASCGPAQRSGADAA